MHDRNIAAWNALRVKERTGRSNHTPGRGLAAKPKSEADTSGLALRSIVVSPIPAGFSAAVGASQLARAAPIHIVHRIDEVEVRPDPERPLPGGVLTATRQTGGQVTSPFALEDDRSIPAAFDRALENHGPVEHEVPILEDGDRPVEQLRAFERPGLDGRVQYGEEEVAACGFAGGSRVARRRDEECLRARDFLGFRS